MSYYDVSLKKNATNLWSCSFVKHRS